MPADAPAPLIEPIRDLLGRGGKRWRPLLSLLVCEGLQGLPAAGGAGAGAGAASVLPLVPLVEWSHNASLVHDDIEDNSPERRGQPALHIRYGVDTAINAGSYLYFLAASCIETWDAPPHRKAAIYRIWTEYLCRLHCGQALDIAWHNDAAALPETGAYFAMCAMKTGCLAEFAVAVAVTIAADTACNPETAVLLKAASDLGVGFQIIDDVKNLRGGISGKKRGDDIVEGKKSLPVLLFAGRRGKAGLELAGKAFREAREGGVESPAVERFIAALEEDGAIAEAEQTGRTTLERAFAVFASWPWPEAGREQTRTAFDMFRHLIE